MKKRKLLYSLTLLLCVLYITVGRQIATRDTQHTTTDTNLVKAEVVRILDKLPAQATGLHEQAGVQATQVYLKARLLTGGQKGAVVTVLQNSDPMLPYQIKEVQEGDKILLTPYQNPFAAQAPYKAEWMVGEYVRSDTLLTLTLVFFGFVLLFGRWKGLQTIVSLVFTCLAIFLVYIPAILSGQNVYVWSAVTCTCINCMTVLLVNGAGKKSLAAGLSCAGGLAVSAILVLTMNRVLRLTGMLDEESYFLLYLNPDKPIDLQAIVFGSVLLGALGAILDVSIDITAALHEIANKVERPTFSLLRASGFSIGRDVLGTMANTLVLAYIGSSLSTVLLLVAYNPSLLGLLNREMLVVEMLQALVGSFGILFTIPFASCICGILFAGKRPARLPFDGALQNLETKLRNRTYK